jgi:4-amino-4-deoxy-L-arabinose transferase-like glycosyltransferase
VSVYAWGAIAATVAFIAITCWWLTRDRSVPIYDAGYHLLTVAEYHNMLQAGNLLGPITHTIVYPLLGYSVGALAMFVGGVNVASPIIGENVVFVSLMAFGCYQTGRLLYGPLAGMLAVVFALGAPLLISLFHVFMLDPQLTALVAVSVWLILASEDFARTRTAGLAGLAVGLGMNVKVQCALYVVGLVVVVLMHGGWRNRRGLATFASVAFVVGVPWYVVHVNELRLLAGLASSGPGVPPGDIPRLLSIHNFLWYFWRVLNLQLLAPLFVFVLVGAVWMTRDVVRERARQPARLELLAGCAITWAIVTFSTRVHDTRYSLPLLAYLAVIGTAWITRVSRPARLAASAVLALAVCASVLGVDFGVGREVKLALAPDRVVLYTPNGFLAAAPSRDGDVPGLLAALRREGVRTLAFGVRQAAGTDFSYQGVDALALIAGLTPYETGGGNYYSRSASVATLLHEPVTAHATDPCTRLSDGTGVWVVRFDAARHALALYCPMRRPKFYGSVAVS